MLSRGKADGSKDRPGQKGMDMPEDDRNLETAEEDVEGHRRIGGTQVNEDDVEGHRRIGGTQ
ncbi:MAG: hypothetical protein QOG21_2060 [Actinomycetota bacterium]|nr:hypothetical protein [Actinomycetota bacterium]